MREIRPYDEVFRSDDFEQRIVSNQCGKFVIDIAKSGEVNSVKKLNPVEK